MGSGIEYGQVRAFVRSLENLRTETENFHAEHCREFAARPLQRVIAEMPAEQQSEDLPSKRLRCTKTAVAAKR